MSERIFYTDIDETLLEFTPQFCRFHNSKYKTDITIDDFTSYFYNEILKISKNEALDRVLEFYQHPLFREIEPVPGAQAAIASIQELGTVRAVTSRPFHFNDMTKTTEQCMRELFQIHEVCYANGYLNKDHPSKSEIVSRNQGFCLVDDDPMVYATKNGIRLFVHRRPWNTHLKNYNWSEILACINHEYTGNT